ncbi:hypothetical protein K0M31_002371 [Melipona bicolor]|uniref:Ig-like domain-containing protein n=1 Tax=Melipona bicolor TaxID=60889 RepID=A0AA40GHK2_9HYME|nr:hypothetical protein K0M31_002371 [Melipona bicolor]
MARVRVVSCICQAVKRDFKRLENVGFVCENWAWLVREQATNSQLSIHEFVAEEIIANLPPLRIPRLRHHRVTDWDPYFENAEGQGINGSQNVALHLGATALLDCRVAMLSGKKVMWLRRNADWASLLTLGNTTHISDPRYSVSFQYPNNWRLAIAGVRREDRGLYVCQVNTHPPRMLVTNVTVLGDFMHKFPMKRRRDPKDLKLLKHGKDNPIYLEPKTFRIPRLLEI